MGCSSSVSGGSPLRFTDANRSSPSGDARAAGKDETGDMSAVATVAAPARPGVQVTRALGLVGAGVCVLSVVFVAVAAPPDHRVERAIVELLVVGMPIVAGLYALRAPPSERFGVALLASGFMWSLTALGEASSSTLYSIGRVAGWLVFPSLIYLLLAYPDARVA